MSKKRLTFLSKSSLIIEHQTKGTAKAARQTAENASESARKTFSKKIRKSAEKYVEKRLTFFFKSSLIGKHHKCGTLVVVRKGRQKTF